MGQQPGAPIGDTRFWPHEIGKSSRQYKIPKVQSRPRRLPFKAPLIVGPAPLIGGVGRSTIRRRRRTCSLFPSPTWNAHECAPEQGKGARVVWPLFPVFGVLAPGNEAHLEVLRTHTVGDTKRQPAKQMCDLRLRITPQHVDGCASPLSPLSDSSLSHLPITNPHLPPQLCAQS